MRRLDLNDDQYELVRSIYVRRLQELEQLVESATVPPEAQR